MVVDASKHVSEVGFRVNSQHPAVLNQGEHQRRSWSGIWMPYKQPVLGSELDCTQSIFGQIVVDSRRHAGEEKRGSAFD